MNIKEILKNLQMKRAIFHSEADFQFALAWEIQQMYEKEKTEIRLEFCAPFLYKDRSKLYVDILVKHNKKSYPIELKYKTRKLDVDTPEEKFELREQSAQDCGRYDFLKDIARLETLSQKLPDYEMGYAIFLTNDKLYWEKPKKEKETNDKNFLLYEGISKDGVMVWAEKAGDGAIKTREAPIKFKGQYEIHWQQYSTIESKQNGAFKYSVIQVPKIQTGV